MNPWTVIGWIILGLFTVLGALLVYGIVRMIIPVIRNFFRYLMTKNGAIKEGQVWSGLMHRYYVDKILSDGKLVLKSGPASWSESPDDWRKRVRKERLRRVH